MFKIFIFDRVICKTIKTLLKKNKHINNTNKNSH